MSMDPHSSPIRVSLFKHLQHHFQDRLNVLHCTKATLVHLSHTLEDLVLSEQLPAILFTGFQESSHWRKETERYRALAEVAQQVCIFAGGSLPPESNEKEIHVTLLGDDPLRQEWFLGILSTQFSVILCGQDRQAAFDREATRQFATVWTLDPVVVNEVLDLCETVVEQYRPDRAADLRAARQMFPPTPPDPALITRLSWSMIQFEEQLHQALMRTQAQLEQQLRWQEDLVNLLVHDLRSPLQAVLMSVQMAQMNDTLGARERDLLAMAESGTKHAAGMVKMLLDTTQLEAGQFPIQIQPVQVGTVVDNVVSKVRVTAQAKEVTIDATVDPQVELIWSDAGLVQRVLDNLLTNAIKFTPRAGMVQLTASLDVHGTRLAIKVRDTGRGIPAHAQAQIFDRLGRASEDDRHTGTGLGLYFCRLALEALSGTIDVYSEVGRGSTFTVTLPLRPSLPFAALY